MKLMETDDAAKHGFSGCDYGKYKSINAINQLYIGILIESMSRSHREERLLCARESTIRKSPSIRNFSRAAAGASTMQYIIPAKTQE
jgi:hypothetical protein